MALMMPVYTEIFVPGNTSWDKGFDGTSNIATGLQICLCVFLIDIVGPPPWHLLWSCVLSLFVAQSHPNVATVDLGITGNKS